MKIGFLFGIFFILLLSCSREEKPLFWGFALDGFPITEQKLIELKETGVKPWMIVFYLQWPSEGEEGQRIVDSLEAIGSRQAIPCLTWEPMQLSGEGEAAIPYQDIINGKYDLYIKDVAAQAKEWGKEMIIRFAQEMNLSRYHWGTDSAQYGPESPEIYRKMFRYVVDVFRNDNVDNVKWAFCPNAESNPVESWNVAEHYYPGDAYVDILGMDGYNWDISPELAASRNSTWKVPWRSFEEIFSSLFGELKRMAPSKPVIVFETASVERDGGRRRKEWVAGAKKTARRWGLEAIVWFQVSKEEDWKLRLGDRE